LNAMLNVVAPKNPTFKDPDDDEGIEAPLCRQRSQKRKHRGHQNSDAENPFPAKNFGQPASRNLGDDVAVEKRAQQSML
jgi:hypothetical protein